jgi:hypothetical protein
MKDAVAVVGLILVLLLAAIAAVYVFIELVGPLLSNLAE